MPYGSPKITGDVWSSLDFQLSEISDLLQMRLETREEARGKRISPGNPKTGKKAVWRDTAPRWFDPDLNQSIRPWLMIPYDHAINQDGLRERMERGKLILEELEPQIRAREITPELLQEWGQLNSIAGALRLVYFTDQDVGRLRTHDNLDGHRRWFADYFLRIYKHGEIEKARDEMERLINAIVARPPRGVKQAWFERFLSNKPSDSIDHARRLTKEFREKLSAAKMRKLVKTPPGDIPSLALDFPPPWQWLSVRIRIRRLSQLSMAIDVLNSVRARRTSIMTRISDHAECCPEEFGRVERMLTIASAAKALGVHAWALRRAINAGIIPAYAPFSNRKLVRLSEVIVAIEASRIEARHE